jgi:hypothetical protein
MPVLSLVLLALVLASGQTTPPAELPSLGAVEGSVLDGAGKPIAGATVYALPQREHDMRTQFRTQTDANGRFVLKAVPAGDAYLHAFKESDGYPNTFFDFFTMPGQDLPPKVTIRPGETTSGATIRLGVKAAILKFMIADENGTPIAAAGQFQRLDSGHEGPLGHSLRSDEILLVPPVPFRFTVDSEGYAPWHYGGSKWEADEGVVRLQSGQTLEVPVRLRLGEPSPTATTGSITGTVFGPDDEPLGNTPVEADPVDDSRHRLPRMTTTAGTFIINGVPPATFYMWAWKPELGYTSEMSSPFFAVPGRQFPTVTVTPGDVTTVDIHLGPKPAYVNILITDERGKPITTGAHLVFSRPDSPERLEKDVRDRAFVAIPSTPMRLSVETEGCPAWHYGGDKWLDDQGLVILGPGEILDLNVQLHPYR